MSVSINLCSGTQTLLNLDSKLPWSVLVPLVFFFHFAGTSPFDLYQACLFAPLGINIGLLFVMNHAEANLEVPRGRIVGEI
jgi:hypothetical protein